MGATSGRSIRRLRRGRLRPRVGRLARWVPASRRGLRAPAHMGSGGRRSHSGAAVHELRPRHGVRGGGLPEHFRMLGRRHGHVHGRTGSRCTLVPADSASWTLSSPTPAARSGRAGSGWPRRSSAWGSRPRGRDLCGPATTQPDGGCRRGGRHEWRPSDAADRPPRSKSSSLTARGTRLRLQRIFDTRPDVLNHNIETVARLQRAVRPSAGYARSLAVLAGASRRSASRSSLGSWWGLARPRPRSSRPSPTCPHGVGVSIATIGAVPSPEAAAPFRWRAGGNQRSSERLGRRRPGSRSRPRRGVTPHPVELPRTGGGRRGRR